MFLTWEEGGQVSWNGGALGGLRAGAHTLGTCRLQVNKQRGDALDGTDSETSPPALLLSKPTQKLPAS